MHKGHAEYKYQAHTLHSTHTIIQTSHVTHCTVPLSAASLRCKEGVGARANLDAHALGIVRRELRGSARLNYPAQRHVCLSVQCGAGRGARHGDIRCDGDVSGASERERDDNAGIIFPRSLLPTMPPGVAGPADNGACWVKRD